MHNVQVTYDPKLRKGSLVIDGMDLSHQASAVAIKVGANDDPEIVVTIGRYSLINYDGETARVVTLADETRELLTALGWTPPAVEGSDDV
jgi:uncharacterized protein YabE (DUF348 family)